MTLPGPVTLFPNVYSRCVSSGVRHGSIAPLKDLKDFWRLDDHMRTYVAELIQKHTYQLVADELQTAVEEYKSVLSRIEQVKNLKKADVLKNKKVIGMTMTGACINHDLLKMVKPAVVLVEEAAEVLEPHIMALLGEWVRHLILIGDHKQLRPQLESNLLARKYHFDVSMMERLINNNYPYATLQMQNRMRPEIAELLSDIYPDLQTNMSAVKRNMAPKWLASSVYFWSHDEPEEQLRYSYINSGEAARVTSLVNYLIKSGCPSHRITVLAAYGGQVDFIRRRIQKVLGDQSKVKIHSVDMYQGDENDIVIVSLVRCNNRGWIGFMKSKNRRCVAQSRAKSGLYFIGSSSTYEKNLSWQPLLSKLKGKDMLGPQLKLCCPRHGEMVTEATTADEIQQQGYCRMACDTLMGCGEHKCRMSCQPEHNHGKCHVQVEAVLQCGHKRVKKCWERPVKCNEMCEKMMECGKHRCKEKCAREHGHLSIQCREKVRFERDCGHSDKKRCGKPFENCARKCKIRLPCEHRCPQLCMPAHSHDDIYCSVLVVVTLPRCGHQGTIHCSVKPENAECKASIPFIFDSCNHSGERLCHQSESDVQCKRECNRWMSCGHPCPSLCAEPCDISRCEPCKQKRNEEEKKRLRLAKKDARKEYEQYKKLHPKNNEQVPYRDELLPSGDSESEYFDVTHHVMKCVKNCFPVIHKVEKIINNGLFEGWLHVKPSIHLPSRSELLYTVHETDIDNIVKEGFKPKENEDLVLFSKEPALPTSQESEKEVQIIISKVLLGKSKSLKKSEIFPKSGDFNIKGYDSVFIKEADVDGCQYAIANHHQALPKYVIHLKMCRQVSALQTSPYEDAAIQAGTLQKHTLLPSRHFDATDDLDMNFRLAESQFLRLGLSKSNKVKSVDYYINPSLLKKFRLKQEEFQIKYHEGTNTNCVLAFHGTAEENIESIVRNNFSMDKCRRGMYGAGIYFSEFPNISEGYAVGSNQLLLCKVLPGKSYECPHTRQMNDAPLEPGYDSHIVEADDSGRGKMLVIFDSSQILPTYIIHY